MNIPDYFPRDYKLFLGLKIHKFFKDPEDLFDPVSGMEKCGSGVNIPDPQHCFFSEFN
jgi:hypothetical protein